MTRAVCLVACAITAMLIVLQPIVSAGPRSDVGENRGSAPPGVHGCAPLAGGIDSFPSTARLVIDGTSLGQPFIVRLSSAGLPDAQVQRAPQLLDTIDTELLQLELAGFHPRVGPITLTESPTLPSTGQVSDVVLNEACELVDGQSVFDVFVEIELPGLGETWIGQSPIRVESRISGLPPRDASFEIPFGDPVVLEDQASGEIRGALLYTLHHVDPPFPPAGPDCSDALLTADLQLFSPSTTVNLIGFGPTAVQRSATIPGGFCLIAAGACDDDGDCSQPFDSCVRQRIETEAFQFDVGGFDPVLGSWQMSVIPGLGDSDCCVGHPTPGCSDPVCQELICAMDPFCCNVEWDVLCASLADSEPTCANNCLDPNAVPSLGVVQSIDLDRTYPATSTVDLFFRLESAQQSAMHNEDAVPLATSAPLTNLPPDPASVFEYTAAPITLFSDVGTLMGLISNVAHTVQPPVDCFSLPLADDTCFDSRLLLELSLPPCPTETLWLAGNSRVLRDDPAPAPGLGQDVIQTLLARGEFSGVSGCSGPLTARVASSAASTGAVGSLTPEEFFPADAFFDLVVEIETGAGILTGGPATIATTVNALPPNAGESYFGDGTIVDLLDESMTPAGEMIGLRYEIQQQTVCAIDSGATIVFTGPSADEFDVGIPQGGGGVEYDVVRGDLGTLIGSNGSFASATCLVSNAGSGVSDTDTPLSGDAFYYLARDGFQAFEGTWNSSGPAQVNDRDGAIPACP